MFDVALSAVDTTARLSDSNGKQSQQLSLQVVKQELSQSNAKLADVTSQLQAAHCKVHGAEQQTQEAEQRLTVAQQEYEDAQCKHKADSQVKRC